MAQQRSKFVSLDPAIIARLACPACHAALRFEASSLVCAKCARAYPILDGIPVLIVDRAEYRTP
jgi:uncharacterized protein YbaR (Trm112 family)